MADEAKLETAVKPEGAKETSPTPAPESNGGTPPSGGAKPEGASVTTETLPFHKDPKIQDYISRETARKEKAYLRQMEEMKDSYTKRMEELVTKRDTQEPNLGLDADGEASLIKLANYLRQHPKAREILGLSRYEQLEKQLESSSNTYQQDQFDGEMSSVADEYAKKYGYEPGELETELREFISEDDFFANRNGYTKGIVRKAAKLFFADKGSELAERSARLKLIKEQEEKAKAPTEIPGKQPAGDKKIPDNFSDYWHRESAGGLTF